MRTLKMEIRRSVLERLKKQKPKTRIRKSCEIEKKLFRRKEFREAETVMFYVSLPEEVNTRRMIRHALRLGKRVALPRLKGGCLVPVVIRDMVKDLAPGRYGILEPKRGKRSIALRRIDLVVVPGVAFDARHNRLGRGVGYYDRFLKRLKRRIPVIGLAYQVQRVLALPKSSQDIPVSILIAA
ncbi:MAG: 5-formyltetrahydrofolate cyclo-ligase [Candidatus Omnitrophota bacterium]